MTNEELKEVLDTFEYAHKSVSETEAIALAPTWLCPDTLEDPILKEYFNFLEASINVIHEYLFEKE